MLLEIAGLNEGVNVRSFPIAKEAGSGTSVGMDLSHPDLISVSDGVLTLTILKHADNLFVGGRVEITLVLRCARCLQHFRYEPEILFEFSAELQEGAPARVELWEEDIVQVSKTRGAIELTRRVRDAILLAIPPFPLCKEECRGLCPICGANLNNGDCKCQRSDGKLKESPFSKLEILLYRERSKNGTS